MSIRNKTWTDKQFIKAVMESKSISETLKKLNLVPFGANYKMFYITVERLNLDINHFLGQAWLRDSTHNFSPKKPIEEILVEKSSYSTSSLKKRILKEGIIENKCKICGINEWEGKLLSLHLDHINGIRDDNKLENLRLLCPNCHSQTNTYAGKNKKITRLTEKEKNRECQDCKKEVYRKSTRCKACFAVWQKGRFLPKKKKSCIDCGKEIHLNSKRCKSCAGKHHQIKKIEWPPIKELIQMVKEASYCAVARKLGVSDNAIRKHIERHKKER